VQHSTPEHLALAALGESLPGDDAVHLESCETCRTEVAALQRAVDALAVPELAAPGASVPPPPRVWEAIAAATDTTAVPPTPAGGTVLPFRSRRRPLLLAAASVVIGAVVGAGAVAVLRNGPDDDARAVEKVALDPLADNEASGTAEVVVRDDGSRALEVRLDAPALSDGYYEVWLIEPSITDMVPLGIARPGTETFELPTGLDLRTFPLVDVSLEPLDGNPLHSGVSVARGQLES
jgi:anti-sigma-K factor RskA